MQGKQADPTCGVDGILMGMIAFDGDLVGDVVNDNHTVETDQYHDE